MTPAVPGLTLLLRRVTEAWRHRRALAQVSAFGRRLGRDPGAALATLTRARPDLPDTAAARAAWSMQVCAWINRWAAADPITARRLVDDLAAHAERFAQEPALKAHWALGAYYFILARAVADPTGCVAIFRAMEPRLLAPDHPYAFRRLWAMAVQRWVLALAPHDPMQALSGLGPLAELALEAFPDPAIVTLWLEAAQTILTPDRLGEAVPRQVVVLQADALALAYRRYGTTAAALGGLKGLLLAGEGR